MTAAATTEATARQEAADALRLAADGLVAEIGPDTPTEALLAHLRAISAVFAAVDAGNKAQGRDPGVLAPHRTALYHLLADRRVPRSEIAAAAGVSENAIGFAMKGKRRGRTPVEHADSPAAGNGDEPRRRKPRPG